MSKREPKTVSSIVDSLGITKCTWFIFLACGITMFFDGFDTQIVAYTMSQISAEWELSSVMTGGLSSWGLLGLVIGGATGGILSDRFGRKHVLVLCTAAYSLMTFPIFFVQSYPVFAVLRVAAGIGLGGCIPVAVSMSAEFTPTKNRAQFITLQYAWMIFGWVMAGVVSTFVVPYVGWRFCYLLGGIPLLYAVFIHFSVPESAHWLVAKGRNEEAARVVNRYVCGLSGQECAPIDAGLLCVPPRIQNTSPKTLFSKRFRRSTIGLWICNIGIAILVYGINAWMPSLLMQRGLTLTGSYLLTSLQNFAAMFANIASGFTAQLWGRRRNLMVTAATAICAVVLLTLAEGAVGLLFACLFLGFSMNWAMTAVQPLAAETYPTELRTTGIAFDACFGRFGGFISPLAAGAIIGIGATFSQLILCFAIPPLFTILSAKFILKTETKGISIDEIAEGVTSGGVGGAGDGPTDEAGRFAGEIAGGTDPGGTKTLQ